VSDSIDGRDFSGPFQRVPYESRVNQRATPLTLWGKGELGRNGNNYMHLLTDRSLNDRATDI